MVARAASATCLRAVKIDRIDVSARFARSGWSEPCSLEGMTIRGWASGVALLVGAVACGSTTTRGETDEPAQGLAGSNSGSGTGGSSGAAVESFGGTPALPAVTVAGSSGSLTLVAGSSGSTSFVDYYSTCAATLTIPIVTLPDGKVTACKDDECAGQAVANEQVAIGRVRFVDGKLEATWEGSNLGSIIPWACQATTGFSMTFTSSSGTVVSLFKGPIPLVSNDSLNIIALGHVVVETPVDIAALVKAQELGLGGAGGMGGEGGEGGAR